MKKRIASMFVAVVMLFAVTIPVMGTYDVQYTGIPDTSWRVVEIWHWVVRGDSILQGVPNSIPDFWSGRLGMQVTTDDIIANNQAYFNDLALRSTTMFSDPTQLKLEPGVRLLIGYATTARHYVWRGDTIPGLINTTAFRCVPIPSQPAVAALFAGYTQPLLVAQNGPWFFQLMEINMTTAWNAPLVESFAMIYVPSIDAVSGESFPLGNVPVTPCGMPPNLTTPCVAYSGCQDSHNPPNRHGHPWTANTHSGAPLFLTVYTRTTPNMNNGVIADFYELVWLRNDSEIATNLAAWQQTSLQPIPTNPLMIGLNIGNNWFYQGVRTF